MEEVKHIFKPEFINRVDEMIVFHALNKENIKDITKIMLKQFAKRVKDQMDMELRIADDVVDFISDKGFDKDYGARPIRRALQTVVHQVQTGGGLRHFVRHTHDTAHQLGTEERCPQLFERCRQVLCRRLRRGHAAPQLLDFAHGSGELFAHTCQFAVKL